MHEMPEVLGGRPESLPKIVDVIATIAAAAGSTGWCTAISAGVKHFAGYVPEPVARQLWADPDNGCAGMFGPTGTAVSTGLPDRYLLTGRWPFTSNCLHATCIFMACHHAADIAVDVTATAHRVAGGRAAYINDRVARALAGVHAGRQHILFAHGIRSGLGQIIAGGDLALPPFIL